MHTWNASLVYLQHMLLEAFMFNSYKESKQLLMKLHQEVRIIISLVIVNAQAKLITPFAVKFNDQLKYYTELNITNILTAFELILNGGVGQISIGSAQLLAEIDSLILISVFCLFTLTPAYLAFNWEQHVELH